MKFIKKSLKYQRLQLQYLIGHSQVVLEQENKLFWALCEFIRMFQTIALVLLYQQIIRMLNTNQKFLEPSYTQDKIELISRITMPTILILEYLSLEQIIYFQLIFLAFLFLMLLINVLALRMEYLHFKEMKFQNKKQFCKTDGSSFQSLNLLNSTYNDNDFIEHFLLKQLMITDNGSLIEMYLYRTSVLTNYFTHILFLPQIYWIAIIFYRIFTSSDYQVALFALNFIVRYCCAQKQIKNFSGQFGQRPFVYSFLVSAFKIKLQQSCVQSPKIIFFKLYKQFYKGVFYFNIKNITVVGVIRAYQPRNF